MTVVIEEDVNNITLIIYIYLFMSVFSKIVSRYTINYRHCGFLEHHGIYHNGNNINKPKQTL